MTDNVSKIKERLDIIDVVSGYIKLQKSGVNFKARCPFHNEKTPSFYVTPERQIWHCFGCSKGGDMFGFIQEIENVEFPEALRILAQKAGVELETYGYKPEEKDLKTKLYQISELACKFFEKQLYESNTGKSVLAYLTDRGLIGDTVKEFRLGFAPNDWNALTDFLRSQGYSEKEIVDSGLSIKRSEGNGLYDRFRSRIIFPISDANDQVVGFTGRVFENVVPTREAVGTTTSGSHQSTEGIDKNQSVVAKYINTPQTLIYDKGKTLYGLNKAKSEIRRQNQCILVEGNMDALMSYQAGVKNVVASSGTAFTPSHLKVLQRWTNNLNFCFDTDQAGSIATKRAVGMALSQNFNTKLIYVDDPECKDPADYVKRYKSKWQDLVTSAKPAVDFYFEKLKLDYDPDSSQSKKDLVVNLAPFIRRLTSKIEQSHWVSKLAMLLKVSDQSIMADISSAKDEFEIYEESGQAEPAITKVSLVDSSIVPDILGEALLSVIFKNPALFKDDIINVPREILQLPTAQCIDIVSDIVKSGQEFKFDNFLSKLEKPEAMRMEFSYLKSQEFWNGFEDKDLKAEFINILNKIKQKNINARLTNLEFDIKQAEAVKDKSKLTSLVSKFSDLMGEMTNKN